MTTRTKRLLAAGLALVVLLVAGVVAVGRFTGINRGVLGLTSDKPRLVIAAYFPWYGTPSGPTAGWAHWMVDGVQRTTNSPASGFYDSRDPQALLEHMRVATASGIDAFAVSWWGANSPEDRNLKVMLDTANANSLPMKLAIHFETPGFKSGGAPAVQQQLRYLLSTYSTHPSYLRVDGRPVVFIYNPTLSAQDLSDWEPIITAADIAPFNAFFMVDHFDENSARIFSGLYAFGPIKEYMDGKLLDSYTWGSALAKARSKVFAPAVFPGYDDRIIRNPSTVLPRDNYNTYSNTWAVARMVNPDWIFITSWNEWHEGSEIEPSVEHGDGYLKFTTEKIASFKGAAPSSTATATAAAAAAAPAATATPAPVASSTNTPAASPTATSSPTSLVASLTSTAVPQPATSTSIPSSATPTATTAPPPPTATAGPTLSTATAEPPPPTATAAPPTATAEPTTQTAAFSGSVATSGTSTREHAISVRGPGTISASLGGWSGNPGNNNLDLFLLGPDGGQLAVAATASRPEVINITVTTAGSYTLRVFARSGSGAYRLNVTFP